MSNFYPPPLNEEKLVTSNDTPSPNMIAWMNSINSLLNKGFNGTITTAALTGVGAQGSMTFENGVLIAQTQAT